MMRRFFFLAAAGLFAAACQATPTPIPTAAHLSDVDWAAYHDPAGFSIQYPPTWQRRDNGQYPIVFGLEAAPGTTLLEKTMEINVAPGTGECRQTGYGAGGNGAAPENVSINGIDFLREYGGGIAAGNIYDTVSYSTQKAAACITVTFVLHSASSGVYVTEPAPYDKAAESEIFEALLSTFKFED
jgi:hypothetical protein